MSKKLAFLIVDDFMHGDEDSIVTTLYDSMGQEIMSGDYYHDGINGKVDGFLSCFEYLGIDYDLHVIKINN